MKESWTTRCLPGTRSSLVPSGDPLLGALVLGCLLPGCAKLPQVQPIEQVEPSGDYVYYALPRTVAVASFQAVLVNVDEDARCRKERELTQELELELKAEGRYFGISHADLRARSEPDPSNWYAVDLGSSSVTALGLELGPDGRISGGNAAAESTFVGAAGSAVAVLGEVAGKLLFGSADEEEGRAYCREKADTILDLRREQRKLLEAGALPHDPAALELKLARLELAEAATSAYFTGVEATTPFTFRCEVVPSKSPGEEARWLSRVELFRYDEAGVLSFHEGCEIPDELLAGKPQEAERETPPSLPSAPLAAADGPHIVSLNIESTGQPSEIPAKLRLRRRGSDGSFAYRSPAPAHVWLQLESPRHKLTDKQRWLIPQLGEVLRLSRMKTGGKSEVALTFDPETGALLHLGTERTGGNFGDAASSAAAGVDALRKARDEKEANDAELARAERDRAYYEALAAVRAAKDILGSAAEAKVEPAPSDASPPAMTAPPTGAPPLN